MAGRGTPNPPGVRRGGRGKGTGNIISRDVKEMILQALHQVGGVDYLVQRAQKNPVAFLALLGRLLPTQVTGKDGGAILLDPGSLTDAEVADRISSLRRITVLAGTPEEEELPDEPTDVV
jgi:hypothetical protein